MIQQKINPFLWFENNAEAAATFYTSVFRNSEIISKSYYGDGAPMPKGNVLTVYFKIEGQLFVALNGGPQFTFSPAVSFVVNCKTQEEIDYYWKQLSADESKEQCGWLVDKFGLSWQIVPEQLPQLINGDPERSSRVMGSLMRMKKLVIADLEEAYRKS